MRGLARTRSRPVARLIWELDGKLPHEQPLDAKGKAHGLEIERHDDRIFLVRAVVAWKAARTRDPARCPRAARARDSARGRAGADIWMGCGQVSEVRDMLGCCLLLRASGAARAQRSVSAMGARRCVRCPW